MIWNETYYSFMKKTILKNDFDNLQVEIIRFYAKINES